MNTFYSVEQSITVRDKKGWLDLSAQDLRDCVEVDPAKTDDDYEILVFSNYDDAVAYAQENLDADDPEQYAIYTWETNQKGKKDQVEIADPENEDETITIEAKRISVQKATLISASLAHVDEHFAEEFDLTNLEAEQSSDVEVEADAKLETKVAPKAATRMQRWSETGKWAAGKVRDGAVEAASRPSVQATAVAAVVSTGAAAAALNTVTTTVTSLASSLPGAGYVTQGAGWVADQVPSVVSSTFDAVVPEQYRAPIKVALAVGAAVEGGRQLYNHSGSMLNAFNKLRGAKSAAAEGSAQANPEEKAVRRQRAGH